MLQKNHTINAFLAESYYGAKFLRRLTTYYFSLMVFAPFCPLRRLRRHLSQSERLFFICHYNTNRQRKQYLCRFLYPNNSPLRTTEKSFRRSFIILTLLNNLLCDLFRYKLFFLKFYNILNITLKRITQCIKSFCTYRLAFFYPVYSICRKTLLKYKMILCNSFFKKSFIKRLVTNHFLSPI